MRHINFLFLLLSFIIFPIRFILAQTLYQGTGHVPADHQLEWHNAGLCRDMSTKTPVQVFEIVTSPTTDTDDLVEDALEDARDHIENTLGQGLAIIYFPIGDYFLDTPINLEPPDSNIVFQGAGADKTSLIFRNMENTSCFNIIGEPTDGTWIEFSQSLYKGQSRIYTMPNAMNSWENDQWVHFVEFAYDYRFDPIPGVPQPTLIPDIIGQVTRFVNRDPGGSWADIKDVGNRNYYLSNPLTTLAIRRLNPVRNIGIEDMTIRRTPYVGAGQECYHIRFEFAVNCTAQPKP